MTSTSLSPDPRADARTTPLAPAGARGSERDRALSRGSRAGGLTTVVPAAPRLCTNCQTAMSGPYCYQCGQHERESVRSFGLFVRDLMHDVFDMDSRAVRTLRPLLTRPGWLTNEYFAGRRERYVPPLRLYVIASLLFFLVIGSTININKNLLIGGRDLQSLAKELRADPELLQKQPELLAELNDPEAMARIAEVDPELKALLDDARQRAEAGLKAAEEAKRQLREQGIVMPEDGPGAIEIAPPDIPEPVMPAPAKPAATTAVTGDDDADAATKKNRRGPRIGIFTNGDDNVVKLPFLPDVTNAWLTSINVELEKKTQSAMENPDRTVREMLQVLPQSMFILLPVFALLLKCCYAFSRRRYLEHLMVAVHSHCFLFLLLTLMIPLGRLADKVDTSLPWLAGACEAVVIAGGLWIPVYLFLMQKRVYAQGWLMTSFKYLVIGTLYSALLGITVAIDMMIGVLNS